MAAPHDDASAYVTKAHCWPVRELDGGKKISVISPNAANTGRSIASSAPRGSVPTKSFVSCAPRCVACGGAGIHGAAIHGAPGGGGGGAAPFSVL